jgi:cytochrome c peroxidase
MKKLLIACFLVGTGLAMSFLHEPSSPTSSPTLERVRANYLEHLKQYESALTDFDQILAKPGSNPAQWRVSFSQLRKQYKRVEFLLAYLEEETTRDFLNGAPLPTINRVVAGVEVLPPAGMQIIEENLYEDEAASLLPELVKLTHDLRINFKAIFATQHNMTFTDRQVLEAIRSGIFRITSMGLVGFDTPGSGAAIQESAISMEAMYTVTRLYLPYCKRPSLTDSIQAHFSGAIKMMQEHPNFDDFDRLNCIRLYLEPLYGQMLHLHQDLGIETVYQVTSVTQALDYLSPSMFLAETFNGHFYAGIGKPVEKPAAIELGKMLFFDPLLSVNNQRACASCHQPEKAFADGLPKSVAMDRQGNVGRNAPTLINSVLADKYFYDLRSDRLESQAEHVIFNAKEFNTTYYDILDKLNQSTHYRELFREAFGTQPGIGEIARALAAYVRSLKSFESPVDQYLRGETSTLAPEIQQGFNLFMGKAMCGTCHFAPTFSGLVPPSFTENESEVLGVPLDPKAKKLQIDPDLGRYDNHRARDRAEHLRHSFKTPTVRNAALTAPYMHNGVYQTLEEVVDFYNKGGGAGLGLDVPNQTLPFDHLSLTEQETKALVRFMEALTDTTGLNSKPRQLPDFPANSNWNNRAIGGMY